MSETLSIREEVEATRRKYETLMDNEEYKLETLRLTEKERQKILNRLYQLQEEEKYVVHELQQGRSVGELTNNGVKNDGWEHCPRCGSNRVKQKGKIDQAFSIWVAGFIFLLVGLIIWPLLIVGVLLFLISPIGFLGAKMNVCRDCKQSWEANKK